MTALLYIIYHFAPIAGFFYFWRAIGAAKDKWQISVAWGIALIALGQFAATLYMIRAINI